MYKCDVCGKEFAYGLFINEITVEVKGFRKAPTIVNLHICGTCMDAVSIKKLESDTNGYTKPIDDKKDEYLLRLELLAKNIRNNCFTLLSDGKTKVNEKSEIEKKDILSIMDDDNV